MFSVQHRRLTARLSPTILTTGRPGSVLPRCTGTSFGTLKLGALLENNARSETG